jgi:hypothetical protein
MLLCAAGVAYTHAAHASALTQSYEETAAGITGSGAVTVLSGTGAYNYANLFTAPTTAITGSPMPPGYGFYDDFVFSITGSNVDAVTVQLDLGGLLSISDLQTRLYSAALNPTLPVLGAPTGGAIQAWSTAFSAGPATGTVNLLPMTNLAAGTYVLEVRGNVTGTFGGSYTGTLNVAQGMAPVPVPAAFPLMLSGLGFVGAALRRRGQG